MINLKRKKLGLGILVVVSILLLGSLGVQANNKVLVVHSYHQDMNWVGEGLNEGIKAALQDTDLDVEFFYMDTKRYNSEEQMKRQGKKALEKIKQLNPAAVILTDDNAQKYVGTKLVNTDVNVVFCGVNGDPEDYNYPGNNVTGILERPHVAESLQLLKNNVANINKVAFLIEEGTTGDSVIKYIKGLMPKIEVELTFVQESNFSEWKQKVEKLNNKVDAVMLYTYHTIKDEAGKSVSPAKVGTWTTKNLQIPTVGLFNWNFDHGAVLGIIEAGREHGYKAGKRVQKIVNGSSPTSMPITKSTEGKIIVNAKAIERLGIEVDYDLLEVADEVIE